MSFIATPVSPFVDGVTKLPAAVLNYWRIAISQALDGTAGGSYTPSAPIIIQGLGMDIDPLSGHVRPSGTISVSGLIDILSGGELDVSHGGAATVEAGGTFAVNAASFPYSAGQFNMAGAAAFSGTTTFTGTENVTAGVWSFKTDARVVNGATLRFGINGSGLGTGDASFDGAGCGASFTNGATLTTAAGCTATLSGPLVCNGTATLNVAATLNGVTTVNGSLTCNSTVVTNDPVTCNDNLTVNGVTTLNGTTNLVGNSVVSGMMTQTGIFRKSGTGAVTDQRVALAVNGDHINFDPSGYDIIVINSPPSHEEWTFVDPPAGIDPMVIFYKQGDPGGWVHQVTLNTTGSSGDPGCNFNANDDSGFAIFAWLPTGPGGDKQWTCCASGSWPSAAAADV